MFQQIDRDVVKQNKHKVLVSSKVPGQGHAEGVRPWPESLRKSVPGKGRAGGTKAADVKRQSFQRSGWPELDFPPEWTGRLQASYW